MRTARAHSGSKRGQLEHGSEEMIIINEKMGKKYYKKSPCIVNGKTRIEDGPPPQKKKKKKKKMIIMIIIIKMQLNIKKEMYTLYIYIYIHKQ